MAPFVPGPGIFGNEAGPITPGTPEQQAGSLPGFDPTPEAGVVAIPNQQGGFAVVPGTNAGQATSTTPVGGISGAGGTLGDKPIYTDAQKFAQQQIDQLEELRNRLGPLFDNTLDPEAFEARVGEAQTEAGTALRNRLASLGLGGSSLELGTVGAARTGVRQSLERGRIGEAGALAGLETGIAQLQSSIHMGPEQLAFASENANLQYEAALAQAEATASAGKASGVGGVLGSGLGLLTAPLTGPFGLSTSILGGAFGGK